MTINHGPDPHISILIPSDQIVFIEVHSRHQVSMSLDVAAYLEVSLGDEVIQYHSSVQPGGGLQQDIS